MQNQLSRRKSLEARAGFEPAHKGFADLSLNHLGTAPESGSRRPACWSGQHSASWETWSGRRDLNPRLRPWQGRTLPLSYSRSQSTIYNKDLGANNSPPRQGSLHKVRGSATASPGSSIESSPAAAADSRAKAAIHRVLFYLPAQPSSFSLRRDRGFSTILYAGFPALFSTKDSG